MWRLLWLQDKILDRGLDRARLYWDLARMKLAYSRFDGLLVLKVEDDDESYSFTACEPPYDDNSGDVFVQGCDCEDDDE